jgi:Protein of unknown function (DUF3156)
VRRTAARRGATVLANDIEEFERLGYRPLERSRGLEAVLRAPAGGVDLRLRLVPEGRFFGGNWALEVSTAEPVLPATTQGLSARGRGVVRRQGVRFRPKGSDPGARRLAELLSADERLGTTLGQVDFELLAVRPDGRPAIRHLGGSIVWVLIPPIVRATPLPPGQAEATVRALDAFVAAGETAQKTVSHSA